ncbi:MAG: SPFH domain-containing protein [Bdellovibrionales bacterium]|jgi:regulator of protease activity HflC (stomatin/prohibitin superfamily)
MNPSLIFVIALFIFVFVTLAKGIRIVPQGEEWIIERLGKYNETFMPGLNIMIPYIDRVSQRVVTKDVLLDVQEQEVITKDNAVILTNAIAFVKVTDPVKAVYGVVDFAGAIRYLIMTTLRSIVGEMELDQALSSRDQIKTRLRESIADEVLDWGLTVRSVEIQDIKPSPTMQKAMELQASAERERKATVTKAEGDKQAAILQAEARLESSRRDAEAQIVLADASAKAIQMVMQASAGADTSLAYLLGEKYIRSMEKMATSQNAKTILLPADIQDTVRGLMGRMRGA